MLVGLNLCGVRSLYKYLIARMSLTIWQTNITDLIHTDTFMSRSGIEYQQTRFNLDPFTFRQCVVIKQGIWSVVPIIIIILPSIFIKQLNIVFKLVPEKQFNGVMTIFTTRFQTLIGYSGDWFSSQSHWEPHYTTIDVEQGRWTKHAIMVQFTKSSTLAKIISLTTKRWTFTSV